MKHLLLVSIFQISLSKKHHSQGQTHQKLSAKKDDPQNKLAAKQDVYVPPAGSDQIAEKPPRVLSPEEKYALEQNILRQSQKWETAVLPSGKTKYVLLHDGHTECSYHNKPEYQLCARVSDCDICQNIAVCGWCDRSNKCVPGTHQGPECDGDCLQGWIFNDPKQCTNKVKSGKMTNVEDKATELINPEIALRKVNSINRNNQQISNKKERKTIERVETVKRSRPAIVGTMVSDEFKSVNGFVTNKHQSKPMISDLEDEIPISRTHETIISDINTGERLDKVWQARVEHGLERDLTQNKKRRRFKK